MEAFANKHGSSAKDFTLAMFRDNYCLFGSDDMVKSIISMKKYDQSNKNNN